MVNIYIYAVAVNGGVVSRLTNDEERFVYVRLDQLQFDHTFGWWKPNNYFGDRCAHLTTIFLLLALIMILHS